MSVMAEVTFFLGLQIKQTSRGTFISLSKYSNGIIHKFGMDFVKLCPAPMSPSTHIEKYEMGFCLAKNDIEV